jgi:methyltransferase
MSKLYFVLFMILLILLRLGELFLARRNGKRVLERGAVEYGRSHYPYMVALHVLFLVSCLLEGSLKPVLTFQSTFFVLFIICVLLKVWTIVALGDYWNTRIYRVPDAVLIVGGPYKYLKHPNYIIVIVEIAAIPLCFGLYVTALVFSILNAIMLYVRIKEENKALNA